jgi:hypothetical protein
MIVNAQNVLTHNYHHAYPKYGFDSYVIKNAQQFLLISTYSTWSNAYMKICINREKKPVAIFDHKSA